MQLRERETERNSEKERERERERFRERERGREREEGEGRVSPITEITRVQNFGFESVPSISSPLSPLPFPLLSCYI